MDTLDTYFASVANLEAAIAVFKGIPTDKTAASVLYAVLKHHTLPNYIEDDIILVADWLNRAKA